MSGTRVAVKRLELDDLPGAGGGCLSMADQMRTEVEVLSPPRQHRAADGMEQGRHGALLGLRLYGGRQLAGPSGVQRQRCRAADGQRADSCPL